MKTLTAVCVVLLMLGSTSIAWGAIAYVPYEPAGSWRSQWGESAGPGGADVAGVPFDSFTFEILSTTEGGFAAPGLREFSVDGWNVTTDDAFVSAQGPRFESGTLLYWLHFDDALQHVPFDMEYWGYDGATPVIHQMMQYDGAGNFTWTPNLIPAPAAALLGTIGVGLVVWVRRRFG